MFSGRVPGDGASAVDLLASMFQTLNPQAHVSKSTMPPEEMMLTRSSLIGLGRVSASVRKLKAPGEEVTLR